MRGLTAARPFTAGATRLPGVKVFVHFLIRLLVFVAVACLLWFFFDWRSWGMIGAILAAVIGAVVSFAVGYLALARRWVRSWPSARAPVRPG